MMAQKEKPAIVCLNNVEKSFGAIRAVDGVSLEIAKGEFFSLLGPSGCGKTTLLRLIAGFEKPQRGQITIDDKEMASVEPNLRPTNMVFQSYAIFPHLNVEQNVGYGLKRHKINKDKVRLSVHRSTKNIYVQIIDDSKGTTLASACCTATTFRSSAVSTAFFSKTGFSAVSSVSRFATIAFVSSIFCTPMEIRL